MLASKRLPGYFLDHFLCHFLGDFLEDLDLLTT
jgi:hypothetical protein